MNKLTSIAVYCAAATGNDPIYAQAAYQLGQQLAEQQIRLIYGGGNVGLMKAVADGVLAAGGEVTGVITEFLKQREIAHPAITQLDVVADMSQRKRQIASLSDAAILLPGGVGSWDEFFEMWSWMQLGLPLGTQQANQAKPLGILNTAGFYQPLLQLFDNAVAENFITAKPQDRLVVDAEPEELVRRLGELDRVFVSRWAREENV